MAIVHTHVTITTTYSFMSFCNTLANLWPQATIDLCFQSLQFSYKWNQTSCSLHLASFSQHNTLQIHSCCICIKNLFFYSWVVFHFMDIPQFVYPFTYGYWVVPSFSLLYINNAAMNSHIQICVGICFHFSWSKYLIVEFIY